MHFCKRLSIFLFKCKVSRFNFDFGVERLRHVAPVHGGGTIAGLKPADSLLYENPKVNEHLTRSIEKRAKNQEEQVCSKLQKEKIRIWSDSLS